MNRGHQRYRPGTGRPAIFAYANGHRWMVFDREDGMMTDTSSCCSRWWTIAQNKTGKCWSGEHIECDSKLMAECGSWIWNGRINDYRSNFYGMDNDDGISIFRISPPWGEAAVEKCSVGQVNEEHGQVFEVEGFDDLLGASPFTSVKPSQHYRRHQRQGVSPPSHESIKTDRLVLSSPELDISSTKDIFDML